MKFSILIPSYKATYFKECLESCINQTFDDFEVIVVDDYSPEDLKSIVENVADKRIRYYKNARNCGSVNVIDNWNKCLKYAKGDYVICIGDDDNLKSCCLDEYVKLINKYPKINLFHAWTEIINEQSNVIDLQAKRPEWESDLSLLWNRWNRRRYQFIGDFCFKRETLIKVGGFYNIPLAWGGDDISALIVASNKDCGTYGVVNTQIPCFQYRQNGQTITNSGNSLIKLDAIRLEREFYKTYLENYDLSATSSFELNEDEDIILLKMLKEQIKEHFSEKIIGEIASDLTSSSNYMHWFRHYSEYGLSRKDYLKSVIKSIILKNAR